MKLNLGCGSQWRDSPEHFGLDIIDYGQKHVGDVLELLKDFPYGGIYDEVMAIHFLEHFNQDELKTIFKEVNRILKLAGIFRIQVPHKDKVKSWCLSHKTFWNEYTLSWLKRPDADEVYGFGKWGVKSIITSSVGNIDAILIKL